MVFRYDDLHRLNQSINEDNVVQVEPGVRDNLVFRFQPDAVYMYKKDDFDNDMIDNSNNSVKNCVRSNSTDSRCSSVETSRRNSKVGTICVDFHVAIRKK